MLKNLIVFTGAFFTLISTGSLLAQTGSFKKLDNGILIALPDNAECSSLKLEVISDKIIHVVASATDARVSPLSLMISNANPKSVKWSVEQKSEQLYLRTGSIIVQVSLVSGALDFRDATGKPVLLNGSKTITPVSYNGESSYFIKQVFQISPNEAFYGLGQHQNGTMNYRGKQVELLQNNTEVAVPFLLSSNNYGILWDNYSITKVGDVRDYQPLSALKLISKDGGSGWLTATYNSKQTTPLIRAESVIDYSYIKDQKKFPEGYKLGSGLITWEGSFISPYSGVHNFLTKYGGYLKMWIDGKQVADKWRQSWNPGTELTSLDLVKNKPYQIKVEWNPDGGESYISMNWLGPVDQKDKNSLAFASEAGDAINYYFISGKNADEVIGGYRTLTGKATMLPKWSMGLWQSRERYKTQSEILNTVKEFRDRKIPLDNIVLDWSYWKEDQWGSQKFDETRFPDATGMIKELHQKYNTRFMISVWAKFYEGIDSYKKFDKNGWLYKRNILDGRRDWIGKGYKNTFYDAYNPAARKGFWDLLNENLYSKGVDAWWMDASEPDIHSNLDIESRKEITNPNYLGSSTKYFNAFPLQNAKGIYEGQRSSNPDNRVFILTRSAYAGMQRYASATWSGDIGSRWEDFKAQIPAGINFSLSGMPFWTTDIGGFAVEKRYEKATGKDLDEWRELQTRWYQFGAFTPLFRVHGQFPYREIYNIAPESHPAYQSMLYYNKLRYRLMPYIYSMVGKTYHDDYTIMRGLIMDFPNDNAVKNISDQYMFGSSLLINPVYQYGAKRRDLYLPAGSNWYDLYSGKFIPGGKTVTAEAPYEKMPIYVKEGSIIPFGPELQYTSEKAADTITLYVYTGKDAAFNLYEDEEINYNYEKGFYTNIPILYNENLKTVTIANRTGSFSGMLKNRTFNIVWINPSSPIPLDFKLKASQTINYSGKEIRIKVN
ncbi:TIM-barrel domain-containing protein [Pedobacter sp. P351]|uniref:TIM-barrel domain-containing protein n=1 Tax=Pedobacter superstes TaxID=3133441 RepID=UPI00309CA6BD